MRILVVEDDKIFKDLNELSKGQLEIAKDLKLSETKHLISKPKKKKTKDNKSNKRR